MMSAVSAGFATRCAVTSTRPRGAARSNHNRAASPVKGLGCGLSFSTRSVGDPRFTGFGSRVRPNAVSDSSNTATDGTDTEYVPPEKSMEEQLMMDSSAIPENFCIIEAGNPGVGKVRDFADLDATDLMTNIESRKNRIFIMLEEVRRLRVQAQLRTRSADEIAVPAREYPSVIPGFPRITENTFQDYYIYWAACVVGFLFFGGLIAPLAEVKLGIGGTTYLDFIESMHLPRQLAEVDPIVASFTGGAVGAIRYVLGLSQIQTLFTDPGPVHYS